MSSPRSDEHDENPSQKQPAITHVALIRLYSKVMRYRATPFSVPQEGMDPLIPLSGIPARPFSLDPEAQVAAMEEVFTEFDLEDPEVKATREMLLQVQQAQERMAHGLAIQPEYEPFSTLPLEHRGDRLVRQVKDTTVLQPVRSVVTTTQTDTFTGHPSPVVATQSKIRDMRWRAEQLMVGKTVWPAEPLLVMVNMGLEAFMATLHAPLFPLAPCRAMAKVQNGKRSWTLAQIPGPIIPHHGAMVELIGLFRMENFAFSRDELSLKLQVRVAWAESDRLDPQWQILDLLDRALNPPGGLPQTCWIPAWDF